MTIEIQQYQFFKKLTHLSYVDAIYLYGSRARGDHGDRSDIDLAIFCPKASDDQWNLIIEIIELADTLLKIDCIRLDQLSSKEALYQEIQKDKKNLFIRGKNESFTK